MTSPNFKRTISFALIMGIAFVSVLGGILFPSCKFYESLTDKDGEEGGEESAIEITSLSLGKQSLSMQVGGMDYISVSIRPQNVQKDVKLEWSYDKSIIECDTSSSWGVTIKALAEGQTSLRCSYNGYDANCLVTVQGYAENYEASIDPYIYSNTTIIQTSPGITEKVFVSLYGGSAADIDGYTWTTDNTSVCTIEPTGQYCVITAKDEGYSRIKITHKKAAYPYYIGVYVFDDSTSQTFITTENNIVTMNQDSDSKTLSVSLVNAKESSLDSQFSWKLMDEGDICPISFEANGSKAVVTPKAGGSCTLRVTHPDAAYPLDILCRVITIVKNVYIKPSNTIVRLEGDANEKVTFTLENIDESEYSMDSYKYSLDDYSVAEIVSSIGNEVIVRGKSNGSARLVASHEKAAYTREVLLIVTGQLSDMIDASCYITTSQNYIRTKVGADPTSINISLKGGSDGDEENFTWTIKSVSLDGSPSNSNVVDMATSHGSVSHARLANASYTQGQADIKPLAEGFAIITITHPKTYYPTEILVKVLGGDAILEEPLYFSGSGMIKVLNGESADYTVSLRGDKRTAGDDKNIAWQCDNLNIKVEASAAVAKISAPAIGSGVTKSEITISHPKAEFEKRVLVLTADDEDSLGDAKALHSDKLCYSIEPGESAYCMVEATGFKGEYQEGEDEYEGGYAEYDFSKAHWEATDPGIVQVETTASPLFGIVKGLKPGVTTVKCTLEDQSIEYKITVYPEGSNNTAPEIYFTTSQNVVVLPKRESSKTVYATAINLSASECQNIEWKSSDEGVLKVASNGTSAVFTALADEGEAVVSIDHPLSQNTLKIYVRIGSEYVEREGQSICYISSPDVMTMLADDEIQRLDALLANFTEANPSGFEFSSDNPDIASISAQSKTGFAYIKPIASGQAEITISHPLARHSKKVLVLVGNSAEELSATTYLTTSSNVVSISEGSTKNVTVSVRNSRDVVIDGYSWKSSNPAVIDILYSGASAVLTANSVGSAIITVTNTVCKYPLEMIVQVVDPVVAAKSPYIQLTSSVLTLNVGTDYTNITADLIGGDESDFADFSWSANDSSICAVYGQNEVGKLRALKTGTTYITVSHPKAAYQAQLLVVCEEVAKSECYISVPSSIIAMKPTASSQTITASLVNGSATDKYNFKWSLDVYDVIDFVYSANVCTITPKSQGQCTITISHPKAAFDQQIVVTVQEYTDFNFSTNSVTMTRGTVKFFAMQIPNTTVTTHVEYSVANPNICTVSGTKKTAQLTAVGAGTTTVTAKLIASSSGVTQASAEMLVYVEEAPVDTIYITSTKTIHTIDKGKSLTLSATLTGTGVTSDDQGQLKWTTSDSDVIKISGISQSGYVSGAQIYITALKPGEDAIVTCSHEKAQSDLQFYIVVNGSEEQSVTLNKSYISLTKGQSGTTLKATIENLESSSDYNSIEWSADRVNNAEICRVMGSGQTVTIYPVSAGTTTVKATLPNGKSASCTVLVEMGKSLSFDSMFIVINPLDTHKVTYTISPPDDTMTIYSSTGKDSYFSVTDNGHDKTTGIGTLTITGLKEGTGSVKFITTNGGVQAGVTVQAKWDYSFSLASSSTGTLDPSTTTTWETTYSVKPAAAKISITNDYTTYFSTEVDETNKKIKIKFNSETPSQCKITVSAYNPNDSNNTFATRTLQVCFQYANLTPTITFNGSNGSFSRYEDGSIYIGDGETANFSVGFPKDDTNATVSSITGSLLQGTNGVQVQGNSSGTFSVSGGEDIVKDVYKVTEAYRPVYVASPKTNDYLLDKDETYEELAVDWKEDISVYFWVNKGHPQHGDKWHADVHVDMRVCLKSNSKNLDFLQTEKYIARACKNGDYDGKSTSKEIDVYPSHLTEIDSHKIKKMRDKTLEREWNIDEFEGILFWYLPEKDSGWYKQDEGELTYNASAKMKLNLHQGIVTENVKAVKQKAESTAPTLKAAGTVVISYNHNGKLKKHEVMLYYESRNCPMTYSTN
ncbi:MAG: hypothetical protein HDR55_04925 [Treponema sp.]|nr:hypothetical protein [Treponema sp.]